MIICTRRTALLTGRYPITTGTQFDLVQPAVPWGLDLSEILFPEVLKAKAGYTTVAIGKWHLGHYDTAYLPTMRGFDQFSGYLGGQIYPWSKIITVSGTYYNDSIYADTNCYHIYNRDDKSNFTTYLYEKQAVNVIQKHDFDDSPLYLYLSLQAVHEPFNDLLVNTDGIPMSYIGTAEYEFFEKAFPGKTRFEYALSLYLADQAIRKVFAALEDKGVMENTYFIVASDNGGCNTAGGRNGDLRGSKGTLYEGGVKVDAFIYSPLLPTSTQGAKYTNLFHVTDWFPTLLSLAGISYTPTSNHSFDGVDHSTMISNWGSDDESLTASPRSNMVYNIYYNVYNVSFKDNLFPFAVRDSRYKLMRTFTNNTLSSWYNYGIEYANDDNLAHCGCGQNGAILGDFDQFLFDLDEDPNETTNLYDSTIEEHVTVKTSLVAFMTSKLTNIAQDTCGASTISIDDLIPIWAKYNDFVVPWSYSGSIQYCLPQTDFF